MRSHARQPVLLVVPSGSPWERMSFFSRVILGRAIPATPQIPLVALYALIIARVISGLRKGRAFFAGALTGLLLYLANFAAVSAFWPRLCGDEVAVVFTHIVFGLIAAGAYSGLLNRASVPVPNQSAQS
jgi:Na+-translocating ferredoxin:NAD+ oxidoreductase RnfD subunit